MSIDKNLQLKLKALLNMANANTATDGERKNARSLLNRLLKKTGLTEADLIEKEALHPVTIKIEGEWDIKILGQLVGQEKETQQFTYRTIVGHPRLIRVDLTSSQEVRIRKKFYALRIAWKKESELYWAAFVEANHLGVKPDEVDIKLTDQEEAELNQIIRLSFLIKPTTIAETRPERLLK
jgi:hypothetical protein